MSVPDAVVALVVASLPGAALWQQADAPPPTDDLLVFDGIVPPNPPNRYVVAYVDDGTRTPGPGQTNAPVCDESTADLYRWQITSVAPDRQMASWLATRVRNGLVDVRITVDGFVPGLIRHTFSQLPQRDEQVLERPVVFTVDQYRLHAERVPVLGS